MLLSSSLNSPNLLQTVSHSAGCLSSGNGGGNKRPLRTDYGGGGGGRCEEWWGAVQMMRPVQLNGIHGSHAQPAGGGGAQEGEADLLSVVSMEMCVCVCRVDRCT